MTNCTLKKVTIATSLALALSGLYGSTVLATPACDPENSQQANTTESNINQDLTGVFAETSEVLITDLPDKINSVIDKPATASEVKYYSFTALRGQKVMINDVLRATEEPFWDIEYNITGIWQPVPKSESLITSALTAAQKVQIRVSHPSEAPFHPDKHFHIDFGSAPYAHNIRIETQGPKTGSYFWTSTFRDQIEWATNIRDSTGQLLEGATVDFFMINDERNSPSDVHSRRVTVTGGIVEYLDFKGCSGRHVTTPFTGVYDNTTKWQATFNTGHWHVSVRGNPATGSSPVPITQICSMKLLG